MKVITAQELKAKIAAGESVKLLDVREPDERADFHIGGVHIPLGKVQIMQIDEIEDWKDDEIIVYCRSGKRSMIAAMVLEQMGFSNLYNLEGGVLAWQM
ncbi:MAG: rhodanese-like domain-containing protein [Chitinophagaceae bacterium]|nr:NADH oxidase [Chitinophagaceae bacterium]HAN37992.1 NADH oxidase [Chitinophagaceae bacterium]